MRSAGPHRAGHPARSRGLDFQDRQPPPDDRDQRVEPNLMWHTPSALCSRRLSLAHWSPTPSSPSRRCRRVGSWAPATSNGMSTSEACDPPSSSEPTANSAADEVAAGQPQATVRGAAIEGGRARVTTSRQATLAYRRQIPDVRFRMFGVPVQRARRAISAGGAVGTLGPW